MFSLATFLTSATAAAAPYWLPTSLFSMTEV